MAKMLKTIKNFRKDFPLLKNKKLVYLDSAATSLKPFSVIKKVEGYYKNCSANVFRGLYEISERATKDFEEAREKVAEFISAASKEEIIFTRSTTESINLICYTWGEQYVKKGDLIAATLMEHHSNFVPWQQLARRKAAGFEAIGFDKQGILSLKEKRAREILKEAKIFALTHVSNVLGTINPVEEIVREVKKINPSCLILIDGAQAAPHFRVDVKKLGCDFYVFSGHKMLAPTGIGVLWGKKELLEKMPPFNFGGEMIEKVSLKRSVFKKPPLKFEAGTPHIAGALGLGEAIDYLSRAKLEKIREHELKLTEYALEKLAGLGNIEIYGPEKAALRGGVVAFNVYSKKGKLLHPHDIAHILASKNICLRAGHHCAMPLHEKLGVPASLRISFYLYNTEQEIDVFLRELSEAKRFLER
jgi:cysteine desulfurase/selenocysteine lyase